MAIAVLWETPETEADFRHWGFAHMVHHRDINEQLYRLTGINIEQTVLDPVNRDKTSGWEYQHQIMHNAVNSILNIGGFNLTSPSWDDPDSLRSWTEVHATEHRNWAAILGIS